MKNRIMSILLALALLCAILPAATVRASAETTSGTCGDNLTWSFDSATGTLTIQGSGGMDNFGYSWYDSRPWESVRDSIQKITIASGVTSIGNFAFTDCSNLKSVTIPSSVTAIRNYVFYRCSSLTSVTIPNSVTSIGDWAFQGCTSLTSVTIPNSVTEIGYYAFYYCASLTSVTIPNSVTSIGDGPFALCSSMTKINVASGNPNYCSDSHGVLFNKSKTELIQCPGGYQGSYAIPSSVTSIGKRAFNGCTALTSVTIPSSVTSIGESAFSGCTSLASVMIGNGVTSLNSYVFTDCSSLTSVTIPSSVTYIGFATFDGCSSLTSVFIPDSVTRIREYAFDDCNPDLVIYGVAGSTAETYANENDIPFVALAAPKITTQPKSVKVAVGQKATFQVVATGSNLSYQWQYKRAGATAWTDWNGKTAATLTVTGASSINGCQYRCVVSNSVGKKTSNAATLTVVAVAKPVITTQPKSVSLASGECMTFSCAATGVGTLSYQWQYKRAGATAWSNWSGKTGTILNVVAGSNNSGCQYRCAVTNAGGTTYTNAATLTVTSSHNCPGAAFTDMPAKGTIEHTAIDWAIRSGVTKGTSATKFSPSMTVTRSQVVTFLWRACGSPEPKTTKNPFTDVKTTDWFYKAVLWAVEQGITNGTSANKFSPNTVCSRSQTLTFLYRQQGSPAVGSVTVPYTDVTAGAFYENAMKWAYSNGIDKGVTATTFAPNANCVRVSNVVFLYRAITGLGRLK